MNIFRRIKAVNLVTISTDEPIEDVPCGECTLCCDLLAPHLSPEEISSGRYPISLINSPDGPVITMFKNERGGCSMLIDKKCSIYENRPFACRQYDCRKGHHPATDDIAMEKFGVNASEARQNSGVHHTQERT
jgi:Fe-S-cluster containining protein